MADDATQKRHKSASSDTIPVDRISELPESIISYILSSLPTKDAVATSLLSRSWRFRWTKVTSFNFKHFGESSKNQIRGEDAVQTMDFVDFINMVLLSHSGESINKFVLWWDSVELPNVRPPCLNVWVNVAIAQNVRVLELDSGGKYSIQRAQCEFYLPSSLHTCGTLEVLKLLGPFRVKPPNMVCLPKLAELDLDGVIYESDESLPKLLSGCSVLVSLRIVRTDVSDNLVVCSISSPVLKCLFIHFHPRGLLVDDGLKLIIDAPALEDLYLYDYLSGHISIQPWLTSANEVIFDCNFRDKMIVQVLQAFCSVKFLTIESDAMLAIDLDTLPKNVSFKRVVRLVINSHYRPSCLMDLLGGCIKLEELELRCFPRCGDPWRNPACVPRCLLSSLKHLTLAGFDTDLKKEMAMLKYFLEHGLKMERVCLVLCVNDVKELKLLKEISKLSRVSPTCKIYCLGNSGAVVEWES